MTYFDIISFTGGALASCYVTTALIGETQPFINDEGEEEYTLAGYLLLAGSYVIKLPIRLLIKCIEVYKYGVKTRPPIVSEDLSEETESSEYELFL